MIMLMINVYSATRLQGGLGQCRLDIGAKAAPKFGVDIQAVAERSSGELGDAARRQGERIGDEGELGGGVGGEDAKVVRADRDRIAAFDPAAQRRVLSKAAQSQRLHVGGGAQLDWDGRRLEGSHVRGGEAKRVAW